MGSTRVPAEELDALRTAIEDDDRRKAEEAIRSVRKRLTRAYDPKEDLGVLETLRPMSIARILAGCLDDQFEPFDLWWARDHLVELGLRIRPFHKAFVAERTAARRRAKSYIPDGKALSVAFGENCKLVRDGWLAIPFLVQVLDLRDDISLSERDKAVREEALWAEADLFLTMLKPSRPAQPDIEAVVERIRSRTTRDWKGDDPAGFANEVLLHAFLDPNGLRKRMLAYVPSGEPRRAVGYWVKALGSAVRDLMAKTAGPTLLGVLEDREIRRARGTLRRWKHQDKKLAQAGNPRPPKPLVYVALENEARMKHQDPTRTFRTLTEVAELLKRPESSVRLAVKRAKAAGALSPMRLPNSRSYAFRDDDVPIIRNALGPQRVT